MGREGGRQELRVRQVDRKALHDVQDEKACSQSTVKWWSEHLTILYISFMQNQMYDLVVNKIFGISYANTSEKETN